MKKEKIQQKDVENFVEGGSVGPTMPSTRNLDAINVDTPEGMPQELIGENFDALVEIYKVLNSPEAETRLRIDYNQTSNGQKTATVFIDGQQRYFTHSIKEIENFHSWSENKQKRKEARDKKSH